MDVSALLETTAEAALATDESGLIVAWNAPAEHLLGFASEEVLGRPCAEVLAGQDALGTPLCRDDCHVRCATRQSEPVPSAVMEVRRKSGERLRAWVSVMVVREGRSPGWTAIHSVRPAKPADAVGHLGEREVTVLFTDIRGYTRYADTRPPRDVFSLVGGYAELVSGIVQRFGGSVVEFSGDGLMSVFGAPDELLHKESAAVRAAREIVASIGGLDRERHPPLAVGAGIATGVAFVGGLPALQAGTWSAIGSPTNRAARLQTLTRALDVSIVIDTATWRRLGREREDFRRQANTRLRGSDASENVYTLALTE